MPFELQIALRYLLAKRRQVFISVISLVSTVGVTVGVMALVIALALMTGLQRELQDRILGSSAHIFVWKPSGIEDYRAEVAKLRAVPGVVGAAPAVMGKAMIMASSDNFVAINNAITVDLLGQINAESVFGGRIVNGTGGQPEMHLAGAFSPGGRAITLLPSTAMGGAVSRVQVQMEAGSLVTIPRFYADTVITEYGVARLWGKNHRQRAEEMIAVAHPDHRDDLRTQARALWWPD